MELILLLLTAYLLGSIPSALWIGKLFYKTDIRQHGSGNLGGTNTFRVLGKTAGLAVTTLDILKGTAAVLLLLLPYTKIQTSTRSFLEFSQSLAICILYSRISKAGRQLQHRVALSLLITGLFLF